MRALAEQPGRAAAPGRPALARTPANVARVRQLQRTAGNRATRRLLRQVAAPAKPQPKVTPGGDANTITVELADGTRYRVTRSVRARRVIDPGRARLDLCHDDKRVFLRVAWCKGTKGRIDIGANPQGALEDLIDGIGKDIAAGKGVDDVIERVKDAKIEPFAEVDIARSGDWKVSGDVRLDVNRTGVLGGNAGVSFDAGWIKIRIAGQAGGESGLGGTGTIEIPLGRRPPKHDCPPQNVELLWQYTCAIERTGTTTFTPRPIARHDEGDVRLYFDYETAELAGKGLTGDANAEQRARLRELLNRGFMVTGIEGWTSPEGKRELPAGTAAGRFPGNDPLSAQRAAKARDEAIAGCGLRMRKCADESTPAQGKGEKLGLEADVNGAPLERAVVEQFTSDPRELERLPAEERAFVTDEGTSVHRRAERIYPWLRRADVALVKDWIQHFEPIEVPSTWYEGTACPQEVENAADGHWGSRIPFNLPEPSICKSR